jgi:uncharacterized OB-fold protein
VVKTYWKGKKYTEFEVKNCGSCGAVKLLPKRARKCADCRRRA